MSTLYYVLPFLVSPIFIPCLLQINGIKSINNALEFCLVAVWKKKTTAFICPLSVSTAGAYDNLIECSLVV